MISDIILDIEALREITDGDRTLEGHLIALYFSTADRCMAKLEALAIRDENNEWEKVAHELKGASANIRANQMAALCKYAEHEDDPAARKQVCKTLHDGYVTLKQFWANLNQ